MTKKDYQRIAQALKDSKPFERFVTTNTPNDDYSAELFQWKVTIENITMTLHKDNPRFDKARFLAACGYNV